MIGYCTGLASQTFGLQGGYPYLFIVMHKTKTRGAPLARFFLQGRSPVGMYEQAQASFRRAALTHERFVSNPLKTNETSDFSAF